MARVAVVPFVAQLPVLSKVLPVGLPCMAPVSTCLHYVTATIAYYGICTSHQLDIESNPMSVLRPVCAPQKHPMKTFCQAVCGSCSPWYAQLLTEQTIIPTSSCSCDASYAP